MVENISISGALSNQQHLLGQLNFHSREILRLKGELATLDQQVVERIKGGATTGDLLRDAVVVACGHPVTETEDQLRLIQQGIKGRAGEPILRVIKTKFRMPHFEPGYFVEHTMAYLGVLHKDSLSVDVLNGKCSLPVLVEAKTNRFDSVLNVELSEDGSDILERLKTGEGSMTFRVGAKSIIEWFRGQIQKDAPLETLYGMGNIIGFTFEIPEFTPEDLVRLNALIEKSDASRARFGYIDEATTTALLHGVEHSPLDDNLNSEYRLLPPGSDTIHLPEKMEGFFATERVDKVVGPAPENCGTDGLVDAVYGHDTHPTFDSDQPPFNQDEVDSVLGAGREGGTVL